MVGKFSHEHSINTKQSQQYVKKNPQNFNISMCIKNMIAKTCLLWKMVGYSCTKTYFKKSVLS